MDTLTVGMKDRLEWEVTERLTTTRGEFKVFSTPSMCQFAEMASHKLVAPHLKPGQGQVGLTVTIRHMAPTPVGKMVRADPSLHLETDRETGQTILRPHPEIALAGVHDGVHGVIGQPGFGRPYVEAIFSRRDARLEEEREQCQVPESSDFCHQPFSTE